MEASTLLGLGIIGHRNERHLLYRKYLVVSTIPQNPMCECASYLSVVGYGIKAEFHGRFDTDCCKILAALVANSFETEFLFLFF
jgi:hypothetical protein